MNLHAALLFVLALWLPAAEAFHLPEIPFCPFGGLPGWINRITGNHHRAPPPPWFRAAPPPWLNAPPPGAPGYRYPYLPPPTPTPACYNRAGRCPGSR